MNGDPESGRASGDRWSGGAYRLAAIASFSLLVAGYFAAYAHLGLWEDGYFVIRFARNFVKHGVFAWNVSDGPLYGMTSQVLQCVGTALYWVAPKHVVLLLKSSMCVALISSLALVARIGATLRGSPRAVLAGIVGLSATLVLDSAGTGLETPYAILAVLAANYAALKFREGRSHPATLVSMNVMLYLTRPDAILIQIVVLSVFAREAPRRYLTVAIATGVSLALLLVAFRAYYGTPVPLATYLKTQGLSQLPAEHVATFAAEKTKNVIQFAFLCLPFVYIASHEQSREVRALCAGAAAFVAYHYFFTIEHMGHSSRYYLPALAPVIAASTLAFDSFWSRANTKRTLVLVAVYLAGFVALKAIDNTYRVYIMIRPTRDLPFLIGAALLVLAPRLRSAALPTLCITLVLGTLLANPPHAVAFESDKSILLRQIAPRRTFRGLATLREQIPEVRAIFHHDMGAPGVLFPEADVIDLDGLLNERITLEGVSFEELCREYRPEAIFLPNLAYAARRAEVLASPCFADYVETDARKDSPFRIRRDLYGRYMAKH